MSKEKNSSEYALMCSEMIKADPNISEQTIIIMFIEYGKKLLKEKNKSKNGNY